VELHLGAEADFAPARKAHPALRVDDIDGLAARCEAAGLAPRWDDRYPGTRRFYVHDPFGNRIEILQPDR
jgi:catechol 2,3-dioxygenase-like lactoylglutathione lyase family enzyme